MIFQMKDHLYYESWILWVSALRVIPWSGDVNRTWGGLQSQPEIALQMGLQGLGYMHSDLGGFAGENLDDELYFVGYNMGFFNQF